MLQAGWNQSFVPSLRGLLPRHIPDADRDLDAEAVAGIPDSAAETGGGVGNQSQPYSPSNLAVKAGDKNKLRLTFLKNKVDKLQVHSLLVHQHYLLPHKLQTQWTLTLNPLEAQNT